MRFAIPMIQGKLSAHFGHCEHFALIDVEEGKITNRTFETPPPHAPGVIPTWLAEMGAEIVIAGGMGQHAIRLFEGRGIQVITGAIRGEPEELVLSFLEKRMVIGDNTCDPDSKPCGSGDHTCHS